MTDEESRQHERAMHDLRASSKGEWLSDGTRCVQYRIKEVVIRHGWMDIWHDEKHESVLMYGLRAEGRKDVTIWFGNARPQWKSKRSERIGFFDDDDGIVEVYVHLEDEELSNFKQAVTAYGADKEIRISLCLQRDSNEMDKTIYVTSYELRKTVPLEKVSDTGGEEVDHKE